MIQIAEMTSDRLDRYFYSVFHRVSSYTSFDVIRSHIDTPEKLNPIFDRLNASFPDFNWIAYVSADGTVRAASDGVRVGESVVEEAWFLRGLQGAVSEDRPDFAALEVATRGSGDEPLRFVKFAFPVRNANGVAAGVLVVNVHWREPEEIRVAMQRAGEEIVIVTPSGEVVLGPKGFRNHYPQTKVAEMQKRKHGAFLEENTGREMLSAYAFMDGHREFSGLGWVVIARQPAAAAFAPLRETFWTIVGIGTLVAVIGMMVAGVIANRISSPLRALAFDADRIGRESGPAMLPRQRGSFEVIYLSTALRSLLLRLGFVERMTQEAEAKAAEDAKKFESDLASLRKLAETDPLTNLLNRRAFITSADDAMRYFQRYSRPIAMLVVDIDHFKNVNDSYGHAGGDAVIRKIGALIAQTIRETDKVARFGGEEFVVLLREVDEHGAHELAERIRMIVAESVTPFDGREIAVTISIGCAAITAHDRDVEELIERADRALYAAKSAGRNCIRLAPAPAPRQTRAA